MSDEGNNNRGRGRGRGRGRFPYRRGGRGHYYRKPNPAPSPSDAGSGSSGQQRTITVDVAVNTGPYKAWKLYFPEEAFKEGSDTHSRIKAAEIYATKNQSSFSAPLEKQNHVEIDVIHLFNDEEFQSAWASFREDLSDEPYHTLNCLALAIHRTFNLDNRITVRPLNHQPTIPLTSLKVNYFGKLVTIRGTVIRVGSPGLVCRSMVFECAKCLSTQAVVQPQGVYTTPASCSSCSSCQNVGKFEPLQSSPFTVTLDAQTARIQETQVQGASGTIPRSVEVELHGDLVGAASPGDTVSVTGVVQVRGESKHGDDGKNSARLMQLYIEAVSIANNQRTANHPSLTFTLKDYYAIQEIHGTENVFRLLVQSLCPSIFGQEIVKAGLVLGLMGGAQVEGGSRSNPHVLVVGDPGLGKSQLLQATTAAAPRGVYVCGNACTASGLTVSLSRSDGGGFALEAGALVLADRGICCVDELDKMNTTGHGALLEAMEQGSVSVARGGVVCRLAAAPTVLAAANPCQGHYNRAKTVCENLKMSSALLSRFDLVFILLDRPNERLDALLSDHVLALHAGERPKNISYLTSSNDLRSGDESSLLDRLKISPDEEFHHLPIVLLRKYIAYSRKYVHPKLSDGASKILKEFFLSLRASNRSNLGGSPVTTRQLEACIRLTQARARVCLREEATEEDAKDVIEIMKHSLIDTLCDEYGSIEMNRSIHGSGMSSKNQVKKFISVITNQASRLGKDVFHKKELVQLHKSFNLAGDADALIESLHLHGYLLLKGSSIYKLLTM